MRYNEIRIKDGDLKLYESTNKQYLSHFPESSKGNPRESFLTCDAHLDLMQTIRMVDPKGNGLIEGTWNEPIDNLEFWSEKVRLAWLGVSICSIIFFLIIYYWGF